eukprot:4188728-Prymnesium_polylepis.1
MYAMDICYGMKLVVTGMDASCVLVEKNSVKMALSFTKGMRFADCKQWTIDVNDYGSVYYDVEIGTFRGTFR